MMTEVVQAEHGTGKRAAVAGYKVAGKTATAQKVDFVTGGYSKDKRIGSFAGFLPADDPKVAIIVSIDEPEGEPYGGVVAAPAFSRLAEGIMRHLGVAHTEPIVARAPEKAKDAQTAAKDDAAVAGEVDVEDGGDEGDADEVVAAAGEGGEVGGNAFSKSEVVAAPEQGRVMPDLMGRSLRSVIRITSESGLGLYVEGSGHAVVQRPAPGTLVKPGTLVTVRFEPPG
jgi:cell division protein FtsI (penicillin-binding protein 3)